MIFEWSDDKRQTNLLKHRLDFADCAAVFARPMLTVADDRFGYGESRTLGVGLLNEIVVAIVFVESGETVRIVSMRKARKYEQKAYFENFGHRLGVP